MISSKNNTTAKQGAARFILKLMVFPKLRSHLAATGQNQIQNTLEKQEKIEQFFTGKNAHLNTLLRNSGITYNELSTML